MRSAEFCIRASISERVAIFVGDPDHALTASSGS
jgi:hypothetical protein